jgi:hypothetical protein
MQRQMVVLSISLATVYKISHNWVDVRPSLWSSGQSSWLQFQKSGFDSRRYQIFWEVVGLERGPLSLVSTIKELLGRNIAAPVKKAENSAVGIRRVDHVALSIFKSWL